MLSPQTASRKLLIVDDEPEVRAVLRDLLRDTYECSEASSAEEALQLLREDNYQLVISDITMSGISGLDMIPHVRRISPDTVIVMVSGMQTIESAIEALRLGAFDLCCKQARDGQGDDCRLREDGPSAIAHSVNPVVSLSKTFCHGVTAP